MDWSKKRLARIEEFEDFSSKKFSSLSNYIIKLHLKDFSSIRKNFFHSFYDEGFKDCMEETAKGLIKQGYVSNFAWTNLGTIALYYKNVGHMANIMDLTSTLASEASVKLTYYFGREHNINCVFKTKVASVPTVNDAVLYYMWLREMAQNSILQHAVRYTAEKEETNLTTKELRHLNFANKKELKATARKLDIYIPEGILHGSYIYYSKEKVTIKPYDIVKKVKILHCTDVNPYYEKDLLAFLKERIESL